MGEETKQEELEVSTPAGSFKARGTDMVAIATVGFVVAVGVVLYQHQQDSHTQASAFTSALKELTEAQKDAVKQQKLLTCIVSRPEVERRREFESANSFCQQVTR